MLDMMRERGVTLAEHLEGTQALGEDAADGDPFALFLPTLLLRTRQMQSQTQDRSCARFWIAGLHYSALSVSRSAVSATW